MPQQAPCGPHQQAFIEKVRKDILEKKSNYFKGNIDWREIKPRGGSVAYYNGERNVSAGSFYVKSIAVWVPHFINPQCVPSCPKCCSNAAVNVEKANFVKHPKMLYGISAHRYLDTMMYFCDECNSTFTGYNKDSLEVDAKKGKVVGAFNFWLSNNFAVYDKLYNHVVSRLMDTTASMHRGLHELLAIQNYLSEQKMYHKAAHNNLMRPQDASILETAPGQRHINGYFETTTQPLCSTLITA